MDVIFDWNLGNMIYNDLITLRCYGFPFAEIGVVSLGFVCTCSDKLKTVLHNGYKALGD